MNQPLWATPERQRILEFLKNNLFAGRCSYGHTNCPVMRKLQQAIVDKIGLPDGDNPFLWMMRASLVVGDLIKESPEPPKKKPPIVTHIVPACGEEKAYMVVIRGISKGIRGSLTPRPQLRPQPRPHLLNKLEMYHLPTWFARELIDYWKVDDRDARSYQNKLSQAWMHHLPGIYNRGHYDSIAKSEDMAKRPQWEIVNTGVSVFTMARTAKVSILGLHTHIWVDLSGIKAPSKHQKRKWVRYGKGKAPLSIQEQIEARCSQAVKRYLDAPC